MAQAAKLLFSIYSFFSKQYHFDLSFSRVPLAILGNLPHPRGIIDNTGEAMHATQNKAATAARHIIV
jgi:hypothetical protein